MVTHYDTRVPIENCGAGPLWLPEIDANAYVSRQEFSDIRKERKAHMLALALV
jgi:hypothetical protein